MRFCGPWRMRGSWLWRQKSLASASSEALLQCVMWSFGIWMATRDIVQHRNLSEHVEMAFAHSIRFYQVLSDSIGICPVLWFLRFVLSRSKWMPSSINLCLDGKNLYFSALYIYICLPCLPRIFSLCCWQNRQKEWIGLSGGTWTDDFPIRTKPIKTKDIWRGCILVSHLSLNCCFSL